MRPILLVLFLSAALPLPGAMAQSRHSVYLPSLHRPAPEPIRWVGELGGASSAVAVHGPAAYLGEGHRVVIVDVSDPGQPRRIGERGPFPGYVLDLAVVGDRLLVASGGGGLRVLDISDPWAPRETGALDTPGEARAVVGIGSLALLADGPGGLRLIDISDPTAPREVGVLDTVQEANALATQGALAYLAVADGRSGGVLVVDVSEPGRPRELSAVATAGDALGIAVADGHAYVADGAAGLQVIDVADPLRPRSTLRLTDEKVDDVVVHAGTAYVADSGLEFALATFDVTDPAMPHEVGRTYSDGFVTDLALEGGRLYATDTLEGLVIMERVQDAGLKAVGRLDEPGMWAHGVSVSGDLAFVTDSTGLRVLDVADPGWPRELGRVSGINVAWPDERITFDVRQAMLDKEVIAVHGQHVYVSGSDGLTIVDVSRPTAPRLAAVVTSTGVVDSFAIAGDWAYAVSRNDPHLKVLDLAQPIAPKLVGRIEVPPLASDVTAQGDVAFVTFSELGQLLAIDVSDPARPRHRGVIEDMGAPFGIAPAGALGYVPEASGNLLVLDIADPTAMRELAALPLSPGPRHLAVAGDRAYLAGDLDGLRVFDIATPTAPRLVAQVDTPGHAGRVVVRADLAFVADGSGGLQIFRVPAP